MRRLALVFILAAAISVANCHSDQRPHADQQPAAVEPTLKADAHPTFYFWQRSESRDVEKVWMICGESEGSRAVARWMNERHDVLARSQNPDSHGAYVVYAFLTESQPNGASETYPLYLAEYFGGRVSMPKAMRDEGDERNAVTRTDALAAIFEQHGEQLPRVRFPALAWP